ncbi:MAG: HAD family hydrolase [Lactobacillus sp.]|jgi:phosphoglycolate phosphatase-like HAD superfamily hydrolase|nr:HAD family hydrolase [Lactobacillus sp.]
MTKKAVIFDVDGVLLDLVGNICRSYGKYTGKPFGVENFTKVNKEFLENPKMFEEFRTFFSHSDDYSTLPPIEGMVELVDELYEGGYDMYVVTAALDDEESVGRRESNLLNVFGNKFKKIYCVDQTCKSDVLKEIVKDYDKSFFIDDHPKKLMKCVDVVDVPIWRQSIGFEHFKEELDLNKVKPAYNVDDIKKIILES